MRRGRRVGRRGRILGLIVLGAALGTGPALDAASLAWRTSDGCRIWRVTDGDTVRAWCPGQGDRRVRLLGYDAPEMRGRCLAETARALAATYRLRWALWTAGTAALPARDARDRYGRMLGRLSVDGRPVADTMIGAGLARPYDGGRRAGWCGEGA